MVKIMMFYHTNRYFLIPYNYTSVTQYYVAGERESKSSNREFKAIFKEMSVLETALFEEGEALVQSRIRKVLELIGVRNLYPVDIIKHHILPQFTSGSWKVLYINV